MEFEIIKKYLHNNQNYPAVDHKDQIWLHHTAGTTAYGAIDWWNQTPEKVGTAYVIDRDGTIYEVFDPSNWAYHIGVSNDNNHCEKYGIGIEIVAAGQLYEREDGKVMFYPLYPNKIARTVIPEKEVVRLNKKWRGYTLYHKYTSKQVLSLCWLIDNLIDQFNIPIQDDFRNFWLYDKSGKVLEGKPGIYAHSTVRLDKTDIVPDPVFLKTLLGYLGNVKKMKNKNNKKSI